MFTNPRLAPKSFALAGLIVSLLAVGCGSPRRSGGPAASLSDLQTSCAEDPITGEIPDCPSGLVCGGPTGSGEQENQCIVDDCPSSGPGLAHGCPEGAFCYVFDGDEGHYCVRLCDVDADCTAVNPSLRCFDHEVEDRLVARICTI